MTLKNAYSFCLESLQAKEIDEADFKALCICCTCAGISNSQFHSCSEKAVDEKALFSMLKRVIDGEPPQYVIGKWDFYESEFFVGEGVLIPRPETEELVDLAVKEAEKISSPVIFDLCSGSGCIGLSIAKKIDSSKVFCVEKSEKAFEYLKKNAESINNAELVLADISDDINLPTADIIVSNPPYIKTEDIKGLERELFFEPEMALDGGADGLHFYRIIRDKYLSKLKNGGILLLEIGNEQKEDIEMLFKDFKSVEVLKDMYGNNRIAKIIKE